MSLVHEHREDPLTRPFRFHVPAKIEQVFVVEYSDILHRVSEFHADDSSLTVSLEYL